MMYVCTQTWVWSISQGPNSALLHVFLRNVGEVIYALVCMYVCMYACMYVRMYVAVVVNFTGNSIASRLSKNLRDEDTLTMWVWSPSAFDEHEVMATFYQKVAEALERSTSGEFGNVHVQCFASWLSTSEF